MKSRRALLTSLFVVVTALLAVAARATFCVDMNSKGRAHAVVVQMASIGETLALYKEDQGRYPSTIEGLYALAVSPVGVSSWKGPYVGGELPRDPWNKEFRYRSL
jgi:general secretion pathway protein G